MEFYGQFNIQLDRFIIQRYFSKHPKGVGIECGAAEGIRESSCFALEKYLDWKIYNVEASPYLFDKLVKNRPNSKNLNFALSDANGTVSFNLVSHPVLGFDYGNSSVHHTEQHLEELEKKGCIFEKVKVPALTFAEIIQRNEITEVDLFVLDIEGHELSAIEGMKGCNILPAVFVVEHGQLGVEKIRAEIESMGYFFDLSFDANSFFIRKDKVQFFLEGTIAHDTSLRQVVLAEHILAKTDYLISQTSQPRSLIATVSALKKRIFSFFNLSHH